jgi:hypothetical protein
MVASLPAALGFRVHSGWAAVVAISGPLTCPVVTQRQRIEIAPPDIPGSKQPYHTAEKLGLKDAEHFLLRCSEGSASLARKALGDCIDDAARNGQRIVHCGILFGSGRPPGTLAAILASHARIHNAEGEFFRSVILDACKHYELQVTKVKEKELLPHCRGDLDVSQEFLDQHLASVGRTIGPPWRQDQKLAMLVGWLALSGAVGVSN